MSLADAQIVKKMSLREFETGHCEYRFEMNGPVDAVWLGFFKRIMPDFPVRFENRTMTFACFPQDLESTYDQIRDAVAAANVWHAEEREALLLRITAHDESQQATREMEENRKQGLLRQFDGLEL